MAPATFAGAEPQARPGRRVLWDRDSIIEAIHEWVATYGEPPRAADWNPSSAKWAGQLWRVERYRAGRADGSGWPALNAAKRPFGGSLNAALRAAGYEPAKPGPRRRAGVELEQADRIALSPEGRAVLSAAVAQVRAAEKRVAVLERRLARAENRAAAHRAQRDAARRAERKAASTPTRVVRERVVDEAATARAERRAVAAEAKAREQVAGARMDSAEARQAAKRLAARLERSEATVAALRAERRELVAAAERLGDELVAARRTPAVVTMRERSPAAEVREARGAVHAAEVRAARAERELRETVAALRGEPRRLTAAELAELRATGPSGPAVLADALKALALARRSGNPIRLQDALGRVAQAAVTWQERI